MLLDEPTAVSVNKGYGFKNWVVAWPSQQTDTTRFDIHNAVPRWISEQEALRRQFYKVSDCIYSKFEASFPKKLPNVRVIGEDTKPVPLHQLCFLPIGQPTRYLQYCFRCASALTSHRVGKDPPENYCCGPWPFLVASGMCFEVARFLVMTWTDRIMHLEKVITATIDRAVKVWNYESRQCVEASF